jgi:hypothetical protein
MSLSNVFPKHRTVPLCFHGCYDLRYWAPTWCEGGMHREHRRFKRCPETANTLDVLIRNTIVHEVLCDTLAWGGWGGGAWVDRWFNNLVILSSSLTENVDEET